MADVANCCTHLRMSAPVELGHSRASSSNRMSRSMFMARVWILKICRALLVKQTWQRRLACDMGLDAR